MKIQIASIILLKYPIQIYNQMQLLTLQFRRMVLFDQVNC